MQLHIPSISLKYTSQFLHYYNVTVFSNLSQRFQTNFFFFQFYALRFVYSDYFRTFKGFLIFKYPYVRLHHTSLMVYETKRTTTSCHAGIKSLKQVAGPAESRHAIGLVPSPTITILQLVANFKGNITLYKSLHLTIPKAEI